MDKIEAINILERELVVYRQKTYVELVSLVNGQFDTKEMQTTNGKNYQTSINVHWDSSQGGNIRVCGAIDDGGWMSSHFPLSLDLIKSPNDEFIDE